MRSNSSVRRLIGKLIESCSLQAVSLGMLARGEQGIMRIDESVEAKLQPLAF